MADRHRAITRFGIAGFALGCFTAVQTAPVHAIPLSRGAWPIYTAVVGKMTPRPGWADFCRKSDLSCDVQLNALRKVSTTAKVCTKSVEAEH
jgi:hypothetical protein